MPLVQRLAEDNGLMPVFYSIDIPKNVKAAEQIIGRLELIPSITSVVEGLGDGGDLYRMLGSVEGSSMAPAVYALIDGDGILRYSGASFTKLEDAVRSLEEQE